MQQEINFFAKTRHQGREKIFGIKKDDRKNHFLILGENYDQTLELMENMINQDLEGKEQVIVLDLAEKLAEEIIKTIPGERIKNSLALNLNNGKIKEWIKEVKDSDLKKSSVLIADLAGEELGKGDKKEIAWAFLEKSFGSSKGCLAYINGLEKIVNSQEDLKRLENILEQKAFLCASISDPAVLDQKIREKLFSKFGSAACFKLASKKAKLVKKIFLPAFSAEDIAGFKKRELCIRLVIDGVSQKPFFAKALPFVEVPKNEENISLIRKIEPEKKEQKKPEEKQVKKEEKKASKAGKEKKEEKKLYPAKCFTCSVDIELPFKPDGQRPVFCQECLKEYQRQKSKSQEAEEKDEAGPGKRPIGSKKSLKELIEEAKGS